MGRVLIWESRTRYRFRSQLTSHRRNPPLVPPAPASAVDAEGVGPHGSRMRRGSSCRVLRLLVRETSEQRRNLPELVLLGEPCWLAGWGPSPSGKRVWALRIGPSRLCFSTLEANRPASRSASQSFPASAQTVIHLTSVRGVVNFPQPDFPQFGFLASKGAYTPATM